MQPQERLKAIADRPTPEYDEVVAQADYTVRAYLSFYRFRATGGAQTGAITDMSHLVDGRNAQGVHYVSDHPAVRLFNLSLIALLVLLESAANAYFFSLSSEFGLVGGLFQAAAVSLANVASAYFIIGFWGLRHVTAPWRYHWPKKLFGYFAIIIGFLLALSVCLSAAHYRSILDLQHAGITNPPITGSVWEFFAPMRNWCNEITDPELATSIAGAAANAACRPFNLFSLDAQVLFVLGLTIAALAAFEGRRSDAAFPGLSDAARQLERAREDLREALRVYAASYDDIVDEFNRYLRDDANDNGGGDKLSVDDRMGLYAMLDQKVAKYRELLETPNKQLLEEFGLPEDIIQFSRFVSEQATPAAAKPQG